METKKAYFAGGCFWCMEGIFEAQKWIVEAKSWYIWWTEKDANYERVSLWITDHREWVEVTYIPEIISYASLVSLFWTQIDPTDAGWQFADRWFQYTTAIYYQNDHEKIVAIESKYELQNSEKFNKRIATKILPFTSFFPAEEHHQGYYKKETLHYNLYKKWSWREDFINKNWWNAWVPNKKEKLKHTLTPIQYKVTQEKFTERAFDNEYRDNYEDWIYVDIVDGTPLFSSNDKFDSWTGWPSFTKPITHKVLNFFEDDILFPPRVEVKSKNANCHLGHVFDDGPPEEGWKRYCMNSAALRFIPKENLEKDGYGEYLRLFDEE